jgi:hypothetical protein
MYVHAVVVQRYGAFPTSTYAYYDYDGGQIGAYQDAARTGSPAIDEYLQRHVWGCGTFDDYLHLATDADRLTTLTHAMQELM